MLHKDTLIGLNMRKPIFFNKHKIKKWKTELLEKNLKRFSFEQKISSSKCLYIFSLYHSYFRECSNVGICLEFHVWIYTPPGGAKLATYLWAKLPVEVQRGGSVRGYLPQAEAEQLVTSAAWLRRIRWLWIWGDHQFELALPVHAGLWMDSLITSLPTRGIR